MPRGTRLTVLLAAVLGVTFLATAPAWAAPKDLRITSATCSGVAVSAEGLPSNQQLFLLVTNLSTGKAMGGGPSPVRTDANGQVHTQRSLSLQGVQTVDVSIWTKKGETLTMAARDKSATNCNALPMTGVSTRPIVLLGALLLAAGAFALLLARIRRAAARPGA
jgi:LPXTG-motif cell wall-anchored protein